MLYELNTDKINLSNIDLSNTDLSININSNDCYICLEPTTDKSKCKCNNIYLHKNCQKKYIEKFKTIK